MPEDADVVVLNTCSVRERAEEKLFSRLGELRALGDGGQGGRPLIAVAGCVAQQEGESILKRAPHVDVIVGTHASRRLSVDGRAGCGDGGDPGRSESLRRCVFPARDREAVRSGQGVRHHHRGLQRLLHLLRGSVHAGARADAAREPKSWRTCGRRSPGAGRKSTCSDRSSTTTRRRTIRPATFPALLAAVERRSRRRTDPVRQPASAARVRPPGRGDPRPAAGLQAPAPAGAVRLHPGPAGDAAAPHAGGLPGPRRAAPRRGSWHRALDRHDRRLPGRDRRGLRGDDDADATRRASAPCSRSSTRSGPTRWHRSA